ncbi:MAG: hypothetical protein Alpg2KO_17700 [Alphaproteobacteria bacterium]
MFGLFKKMTASNRKAVRKAARSRRGSAGTGYVLLVGLIAAVSMGALSQVGDNTEESFEVVSQSVREANGLDEIQGFSFATTANLFPNDEIISETVRINGNFVDPVRVRVTGGEVRIDGGSWETRTELLPNQTIQLKANAPGDWDQTKTINISVADKDASWVISTQEPVFVWVTGDFEACTLTCGESTVSRTVHCEREQDGETVSDSDCLAGTRPPETEACTGQPGFTQSCPITNGSGVDTCNPQGTAFEGCLVSACDTGFSQDGNACLANCLAATVGGFAVTALTHNATLPVTRVATVAGGEQTFTATANCANGLVTITNETLFETSCDAGYSLVGNSCFLNCVPGSVSDYLHDTILHNASAPVVKTVAVANGTQDFSATASCADGIVTISGEALTSTACDAGFSEVANVCYANCSPGSVSGYSHTDILHGASASVSRTEAVTGGSQSFSATASCTDGVVTVSGESLDSTSCDGSHTLVGNACLANCVSGSVDGYAHGNIGHSLTEAVSRTASITGGDQTFNATATCTDGTVAISGEALSNTTCDGTHSLVGDACLANCTPGNVSNYDHGSILHGASASVSRSVSVTGGTQTYNATASCTDGSVAISGEALDATSCDSSHTLVGDACLANCTPGTVSGYSHSTIGHGLSSGVTRTASITGGTQTFNATASCADGTVTVSGESLSSTSCSSGYSRVGDACFANCTPGSVNGYSHGSLAHAASAGVSKSVGITGGSQTFNATATCTDGSVAISGEGLDSTSCSSGYSLVGDACFADCGAGTLNGYSYGTLLHGASTGVSKLVGVTGGDQTHTATATCTNGGVALSNEGIDSVSCSAAYVADGNTCAERCAVDEYWSGSACSPVGTGFFSAASSNARNACSNKPANSAYTTDGNGSNNCGWACDMDYYANGGSCAPVGSGFFSASSNNSRVACSNKPANSSYTSDGNGGNNCGWSCNGGFTQSGSSCLANCSSGSADGYSYGALTHGANATVSKTVSVLGGTQTWNATASCSNGSTTLSGSSAVSVACNAEYAASGTSCLERCGVDQYWNGSSCAAVGTGFFSAANTNARTACTNAASNSVYTSDGNGANNCGWACNLDFYLSGGSCVAVGTGYYSAAANNSRVSCSNKPSNSNYTSDGNGSNSCSWGCITDFYQNGSSCSAVGTGYYSANNSNSRVACTNKPSGSNYTSDGNGSNACSWACQTDRYQSGSSCPAVGTGYYSPNNNNSRTACTNKPSNSNYTGDGNGSNSCPWACVTDFYQNGSSCSAVGTGYYSANNNNSRVACTNKPSNSNYTSDGNGSNNCGWSCVAGYTQSGNSCGQSCGVDQYWNGSSCVAVGTGYYSPASNNSRTACTNKPSNSNYTGDGNGSNNCPYGCITDRYLTGGTCAAVGTGYYSANNNNSRVACSNKPSGSNYISDGNGANACSWACQTDRYKSGSSCPAVGTGYYSANNNNSRVACTNKPSNSNYTSDGNGSNSCSWACSTDFYKSGSSCIAVGTGYYSSNSNNSRVACSNKPSNSNYTSDGNGSNACGWACVTDFYKSGSSCVAVGTGYYSANSNNSRVACTNKPSSSNYNSDGNGSNNCGWACQTDRYKSGSSCPAVGTGYYSPNSNNTRYSCSNKPGNSSYTGDGNGANACPWSCNSGYTKSGNSCVSAFSCGVPAANYTCSNTNNGVSTTINSGGATACRNWCDNYSNTRCCYFLTNTTNTSSGTCFRYPSGSRSNTGACQAGNAYNLCGMASNCN